MNQTFQTAAGLNGASPRRVHVIAEAGTNHAGSFETGQALIDVAQECGADSVKFQIIYPEGLYLPEFYKDGVYLPNEVFLKRQAGMLSDEDWRRLRAHAAAKGIPFGASAFDRRGLDLLEELDTPYIKIASCDLNNEPFLKEAAARGRRLIVSTGMSTLLEIERSVQAILAAGCVELVLMHCVSVYPCRVEDMNLGFLDVLKANFGLPLGLSDHTESSLAAAIAIGKGASWIEKHFTLNRAAVGFDHAYALEPPMLAQYIRDVRASEAGSQLRGQKVIEAEASVKQRARRAVYAARDVAPGEKLTAADLLIVRPEGPITPAEAKGIPGLRARRGFRRFEALTWEGLAA